MGFCASSVDLGAEMNTKTAADKWFCTQAEVREWCRGGIINAAVKEKGRWSIPQEAKRPLDRKLQREILWRIIEVKNGQRASFELTDWGIPDADLPGYLEPLFGTCLRGEDHAAGWDEVNVSSGGLRLLGRNPVADDTQPPVPVALNWCASLAGTYTASFLSNLPAAIAG